MNRHSPKPNECHRCKSRNELRGVVVAALKLITLLRSGIAAVASDHTITYDHHCYRLHGTDISIHSGSIHMVLGGTNVGYWGASYMSPHPTGTGRRSSVPWTNPAGSLKPTPRSN
ncbi:MAG TPA: hypothetical protein EYP56_07005 [Planctomycetaceae bacterium]|nr:hypothetical protein [Planctomycetaceae bacterium]